jgi:hypothetical protein
MVLTTIEGRVCCCHPVYLRRGVVQVINMPRAQATLDHHDPLRQANPMPPLDPDFADVALSGDVLTPYDREHLVTYLRLLDAHAEGADWREVARVVLHLDPEDECDRVWKTFDSHLSRAKWISGRGYRYLLQDGGSA